MVSTGVGHFRTHSAPDRTRSESIVLVVYGVSKKVLSYNYKQALFGIESQTSVSRCYTLPFEIPTWNLKRGDA